MTREIIEGMSLALTRGFGKGYSVYADRVGQGLEVPCFSINLLSCESRPQVGGRTKHTLPFNIMYFAPDGEKRIVIWEVQQRLRELLDQIVADGVRLRGSKMKSQQIDGVLHFHVEYSYYSVTQDEVLPMEVCTVIPKV